VWVELLRREEAVDLRGTGERVALREWGDEEPRHGPGGGERRAEGGEGKDETG